jgi:YVTN family beta-propeller protein
MKKKQFLFNALAVAIAITSCKKDKPETPVPTPAGGAYDNGVFITNEGPYGTGTGTVSFYNRSNSSITNDIFQTKNSYPLGNIVQSMEIFNGKGYLVVNNAGKVEIVNGSTFESNGVISGLENPRYFLGVDNNKGYVSEWGAGGIAGAVKVIDLTTKGVTAVINTGKGAEGMVKVGNAVYVACSGGYDKDSVVTVINATTNAVITNINVGANPKNIKVDANGKIWVLCSGEYAPYPSTSLVKTGKLIRIDASTNTVDLSLPFSSTTSQPYNLVINNAKTLLYYSYDGKVYSQSYTDVTLNTTPTISRNFYGFGIDPTNDYFYGSDAGNFSSNGKVIRYNTSAVAVDSFTVGIIPGNFCFK